MLVFEVDRGGDVWVMVFGGVGRVLERGEGPGGGGEGIGDVVQGENLPPSCGQLSGLDAAAVVAAACV